LGDIVVTARRVSERAQDVPLAVTAIGGAALQERGVQELRDLSAIAPNLSIQSSNTGAGSAALSIRGQNSTTVSLAVDSAVGLYVDGVNVPRTWGIRGALVDIDRVEVLRGPQGTLYGRNTTGGAVSVYTKDATDEFGASLQLSAGNYESYSILGVLNLPIAEGLNSRFVVTQQGNEGFGNQVNIGRRSAAMNNTYARGKLDYNVGDLHLTASGDYFRMNTKGLISRISGLTLPTANSPFGGGNAARATAIELGLVSSNSALTTLQTSDPAQFAAIMQQASNTLASYINRGGYYEDFGYANPLSRPRELASGYSLTLNGEYKLNDEITIRSITGFRHIHARNMVDNDGTPFIITESNADTKDDFFSEELQLLGETGRVQWVIGGFYSKEDGTTIENSRSLLAISPLLTTNDGDIGNTSYAAFGQLNWRISDSLTFTAGARWTKETRTLTMRNRNSAGCTIAPVFLTGTTCSASFKGTFSDPSWLASLDYKLAPDVLVYAKFSRGFRGGGLNTRASGSNVLAYRPYAPETLTEYEVGLKSEFLGRRLRLNLAAFYDDYKDIQRSIVILVNPATNSIGQIQTNAAKATLKGIEAEITGRLTDNLTLSATYGGFKHRYKDFADFTGDRSGEPWPAPHYNYTIVANYSAPVEFGRVVANLNWAAQGRTNLSPSALRRNQLTQDAYGLLNGRLSVTVDRWQTEFALFGRNLLNKEYRQNGINLEALGINRVGPGEPRTYGVQLTKRFGGI
jgi:iron complex outermembrane receptor protein